MKLFLFCILNIIALQLFAEEIYPLPLSGAGSKICDVIDSNLISGWRLKEIEPGKYYIHAVMESDAQTALSHLVNRNTGGRFYLNGNRIGFTNVSPLKEVAGGKSEYTAQSELISLKKGDGIVISPELKPFLKRIELSQNPLPFAPIRVGEWNVSNAERKYNLKSSTFEDDFKLVIDNLTGQDKNLAVTVTIVDFFQNQVGKSRFDLKLADSFTQNIPFQSGKSPQYRAIVEIIDQDTQAKEQHVFAGLKDCANDIRKIMWLNDKWEKATVADDGTEKTRTIQPQAPAGSNYVAVSLPDRYDSHIAWYKRELVIPKEFRNDRYLLYFDRLTQEADIYVNGKLAAQKRADDFIAPYQVDITDAVRPDQKNIILIACRGMIAQVQKSDLLRKDMTYDRWKSDYTDNPRYCARYGRQGLAEVRLESVPEKRIGDIKIITSYRQRSIEVKSQIPTNYMVKHHVMRQGKELISFADKTTWENPVLWGPDEFPLLELVSELYDPQGRKVDEKKTRFGFREIWIEGNRVLWNGSPLRMTSAPDSDPWYHSGIDYESNQRNGMLRSIENIKNSGYRKIYHVSSPGAFLELMDEAGLICSYGGVTVLAQNEYKNGNDEFWRLKDLNDKHIIDAFFNHPSVFTWYISNEYYGESYDKCFERLKAAYRSVSAYDPTRLVENGCDLDLRGVMPFVSTHYPVEMSALRDPKAYFPDALYWRKLDQKLQKGDRIPCGQIQQVCNVVGTPDIKYREKPLSINETQYLAFYQPPHGMTSFLGDLPYRSEIDIDNGWKTMIRESSRAHRDVEPFNITPWRFPVNTKIADLIPAKDIYAIQQYHVWYENTPVKFDVNVVLEPQKKQTYTYFWRLLNSGKPVCQEQQKIDVDHVETFRDIVKLPPLKPGEYVLEAGLDGEVLFTRPISVVGRISFTLPSNVFTADRPLDRSLLKRAEDGETIVILSRKDYPGYLPEKPELTSRDASVNFSYRQTHPVFDGIKTEDLSFWFPDHKVGENYFRKPYSGNAQTLLEAGGPDGLIYSGLIEVPYGKGAFLYSRLNLDTDQNPVALQLLKNMAAYKRTGEMTAAGFLGPEDSAIPAMLQKYGVVFNKISLDKIGGYPTLLVDGAMPVTADDIKKITGHNGKQIVFYPGKSWGIDTAPAKANFLQGRAFRIGNFGEIAGLTNYDFFFRNITSSQYPAEMFDSKLVIDKLGESEMTQGAEPLVYPRFLAKKGNTLFCTINFMSDNAYVSKQLSRIMTTVLTNAGVKCEFRKKMEIPDNLHYTTLDLKKFLDRTFIDNVADDGQDGWNDQGPELDMRNIKIKSGIHTFAGIPFRIEQPKSCFVLASRYRKNGYESLDIPVNAKFSLLAFLHSAAWCSDQHHYSIYINYADSSMYEIKMSGKTNMGNWCFAPKTEFPNEFETLTQCALTVPQMKFSFASLYQTVWLNPYPDKEVRSLTFKSMQRGVAMIAAITLGGNDNPYMTLSAEERKALYDKTLSEAVTARNGKEYQKAIDLYEKAYLIDPAYPAVLGSIGNCWEDAGEYEKAALAYERALKADINQPHIHSALKYVREK